MSSTTNPTTTPPPKFYALIDYEDPYVQPLLLSALEAHLSPDSYALIPSLSDLPTTSSPVLQIQQYESLDFTHQLSHPSTSLSNAYVIRKALIRKHYLSTTIAHWLVKYPSSILGKHVKPSVEFEVDYAEFLDDALVEAWELKESWARGEQEGGQKEWWILKPGMSERGQGIRLFSTEQELVEIFEEWDPESSDDEEEEDARSDHDDNQDDEKGIITSQLRHFIAQPYIHPPLLLSPPSSPSSSSPSELRKFHIRTYILATGALKIYIYRPMLALFAARPYTSPSSSSSSTSTFSTEAMQSHLTNTCLQDARTRDGSVGLFWSLPSTIPSQPSSFSSSSSTTTGTESPDEKDTTTYVDVNVKEGETWKEQVFQQICAITAETFEAAARGMSIHFQPLPNSFEVFGLDFMVSLEKTEGQGEYEVRTWLLEVNAFPDFRQTGEELKGLVGGLFKGVVEKAVRPFFFGEEGEGDGGDGDMVKVLDIDLGRR
ncbi:TTL-domain-containing protein [Periconia macrospinosa]|uniref:TTL-domain-containing protein n=1 Tax=Periconia macrospinosa TaxID=97972 RepID=A0A2V1D9U3_9PLEO|nr:TTL-domain-containing protein [Periconia macrospinosa]